MALPNRLNRAVVGTAARHTDARPLCSVRREVCRVQRGGAAREGEESRKDGDGHVSFSGTFSTRHLPPVVCLTFWS